MWGGFLLNNDSAYHGVYPYNFSKIINGRVKRRDKVKYISIEILVDDICVFTKDGKTHLGYIELDKKWNKWVFEPVIRYKTIHDSECLVEISEYLKRKMGE